MNNIEFRSGAINPSQCVSEGWNLLKPNYGAFLAMTVVEIIIVVAVGMIPYVGEILNSLVAGPLICGIYLALLVQTRGENARFSTMFEGFNHFLSATLVSITSAVPLLIFSLGAYFVGSWAAQSHSGNPVAPFGFDLSAPVILAALMFYLATIVLQLLLAFALPLIADRKIGFVEAVKLSVSAAISNIGGLIVLFLLEGLLLIGGTLVFCVGILFVLPVMYAANIIAYRSVFPENQPTFYNEPPQPDAYGTTYGMPS